MATRRRNQRAKVVSAYSDECGGTVRVSVRPTDAACDHGKQAYEIKVARTGARDGKPLWAPRAPLCVPRGRDSTARVVEDAIGFFEHARCGRGNLDGARKRRRR